MNEFFSDPPGIVTIAPGHDTFYTKPGGQPLHDITCEADCQPKCTYSWYRKGDQQLYTKGNRLFDSKTYNYRGTSRFNCYATNDIGRHAYNYSRWIKVEVKGMDVLSINIFSLYNILIFYTYTVYQSYFY